VKDLKVSGHWGDGMRWGCKTFSNHSPFSVPRNGRDETFNHHNDGIGSKISTTASSDER